MICWPEACYSAWLTAVTFSHCGAALSLRLWNAWAAGNPALGGLELSRVFPSPGPRCGVIVCWPACWVREPRGAIWSWGRCSQRIFCPCCLSHHCTMFFPANGLRASGWVVPPVTLLCLCVCVCFPFSASHGGFASGPALYVFLISEWLSCPEPGHGFGVKFPGAPSTSQFHATKPSRSGTGGAGVRFTL